MVLSKFSGRQFRFGSNTIIIFISAIVIIIVVNSLFSNNPLYWDLTQNKTNTLSVETKTLIDQIDEPINIQAFFTDTTKIENLKRLLDNYALESSQLISYSFIDAEVEPIAAQNAGIVHEGTLVLEMSGKKELISNPEETQINSAIFRLLFPGEKTVFFTMGHGEGDINGLGDNPYSKAIELLAYKGYSISQIDLTTLDEIPANVNTLVIAGPVTSFSENDVLIIKDFITDGRGILLLLEPEYLTDINRFEDPLVTFLIDEFDIELGPDIVIDPTSLIPWGVNAIPIKDSSHPIITNMSGLQVLEYTSRSIRSDCVISDFRCDKLIHATDQTWGETSYQQLNQGESNQDAEDFSGPISLAIALEGYSKGRLVIVGDSSFANDNYISIYGNSDFFLNAIDWLTFQNESISISPKVKTGRYMITLTPEQMNLIFLCSVILPPAGVFIAGIAVWSNKKRRK